MNPIDLKHWDAGQIRDFVKEAWSSVGADGWNLLVPRLQKALIAEKVLSVVLLNTRAGQPGIAKEAIVELREAMMAEAGLEDS